MNSIKTLLLSTLTILLAFCTTHPVNAQFGMPPIWSKPNKMVTAKTFPLTTTKEQLPEKTFKNYCTSELNASPSVQFIEHIDRLEWTCRDELIQNTFTEQWQHVYYIPSIEWCTDSTALNYNPSANVHKESLCEYAPPYAPQDITGAFNQSQVSIGATTWTIRVNLNVTGATLDPSTIQTWNRFKAVSATSNEKTLEIVMRQFDDQRLNIEECTSYELTIPRNALYTTQGDTNANPISGNFEVIWCQEKPTTENETENTWTWKIQEIQQKYTSTMNKDAFYVRLFDVDENGNQHINLGNLIFLIGFAWFFISAMFLFLNFLKNSFLWKSKK